jgi:hypothetical protein
MAVFAKIPQRQMPPREFTFWCLKIRRAKRGRTHRISGDGDRTRMKIRPSTSESP